MACFAHTHPDRPAETWDLLEDHLFATAALASRFARRFAPLAGELVGRWHDLGKFNPAFQTYLTCPGAKGPRHSIVGAWWANRIERLDLAMIIAAHHGRLDKKTDFLNKIESGRFDYPVPPHIKAHHPVEFAQPGAEGLWMRFLFSALVDADSLETERWDKPGVARWRCAKTIPWMRKTLEDWLAKKEANSPATEMNTLRRAVQSACIERSLDPMGPFRLTVPTGGGKTLASLLFALHHAEHHGLERVIVVIPYTSIIDQTVKIFGDILGSDAVLEHHSNLDPEKDNLQNRHCVENWDSPVIVTTSVQFFETLHANRKKDLRKLHNVAGSVVVLDEVQTFPLPLIKPIKDSLERLTRHFSVTTLHCSATQPLLAQPSAREIIPDLSSLFSATQKRVAVVWPEQIDEPVSWQDLAARIMRHPGQQVLTIVHSKRDAIELAVALGEGCIHLSTLMCATHRRATLTEIQRRLRKREPCTVVSTQLVEAGVDLDFPVVYRALAGVDSLAQAAGRCNREGRLADPGEFYVFLPPSDPPAGVLRDGFKQVRSYLKRGQVSLFDPTLPARYFSDLVGLKGYTSDIPTLEKSWDFPAVADAFKMIDDYGTPVIAPYGPDWLTVVKDARQHPGVQNFRRLQPYTVSLPDRWLKALQAQGVVEALFADSDESYCILPGHDDVYSERFGFGGVHEDLPVLGVWEG